MSKYCPECGKQGIAAGGKICSYCGHNTAASFSQATSTQQPQPTKETFTPFSMRQRRGGGYVNEEDERVEGRSVDYFDSDSIDGLEFESEGTRDGGETLGSLDSMNPQACNEYRQAAQAFQKNNK